MAKGTITNSRFFQIGKKKNVPFLRKFIEVGNMTP